MSNISSVLGLIIAVFALCVSFNAYNLTIRGAKFSTLISTIPDYVEGLKEDGQYGVREGWKNYENGGKSISLKKAKTRSHVMLMVIIGLMILRVTIYAYQFKLMA